MITSRRLLLLLWVLGIFAVGLPAYGQSYDLSPTDLYKPPGASCTSVWIQPYPIPVPAYLEIDSGAAYFAEGQNCIDENWAEGWHNITAIVYDLGGYYDWYAASGGFNVYPAPPPSPVIYTAGAGCDNWDCIWIQGTNFHGDSKVAVCTASCVYGEWHYGPDFQMSPPLNVYLEESPQRMTLHIEDPNLAGSFGWNGLYINVVNSDGGESGWQLVTVAAPTITSGGPTCADLYCIYLNGEFPLSAYVDFRIPGQSEILSNAYTDLVVTASQITLRLNPNARYAYDTTGLNAWVVNPSVANWSNGYYLAPVDRRITGFIEGISQQGSNYFLYGWACAKTYPGSIDVHVYVGGPAGGGTFAFSGTANLVSDTGIAAACNSTGSNYRFWLQIPQSVMAEYGGQRIWVHGISPFGLPNLAIGNSGNLTIPGAPVISLKEFIYLGDRVIAVETTNQ